MTWTKKDLKRSYVCNADLLLQLREWRGWTQAELAERVGYTTRLLCKAESGKPISTLAIDSLAEAFSTPEETVYPEDLISDPVRLAKEFMTAFYLHREKMISATRYFLDDDAVFVFSGNPDEIPFAGEHIGIAAVEHCFALFFSLLEAPETYDVEKSYQFLSRGNEVIVWGATWFHPIGVEVDSPMKITIQMKFRRGKMWYFNNRFDTLEGAKLLKQMGVEHA